MSQAARVISLRMLFQSLDFGGPSQILGSECSHEDIVGIELHYRYA